MKGLPTTQKRIPPYVAYSTFKNFLLDHRQGVPTRIDNHVMENLSGQVRAQLLHALRYLELVDENGATQPILDRLVQLDEKEQKRELREVIQKRYPFLFGEGTNKFDITKAAHSELREKFLETGATGSTVRKVIAFFLNAARDTEIPVSTYILAPKKRTPTSKAARQKRVRSPRVGQDGKPKQEPNGSGEDNLSFEVELPTEVSILEFRIDDLMGQISARPDEERANLFERVKLAMHYAEMYRRSK